MNRGRKPGAGVVINAVRVDRGEADPDGFTYTVVIDAKPPRPKPARPVRPPQAAAPRPVPQPVKKSSADRRDAPRQRTRLRSGKIVDAGQNFLTECLVHDLSETGMRLRLPAGMELPATFQVYDDLSSQLMRAEVTWRRGDEAGVRFFKAEETARSRTTAADMRRKFYKMPR